MRHGHEAWQPWKRQRRTERQTGKARAKRNGLGASVQQRKPREPSINRQVVVAESILGASLPS